MEKMMMTMVTVFSEFLSHGWFEAVNEMKWLEDQMKTTQKKKSFDDDDDDETWTFCAVLYGSVIVDSTLEHNFPRVELTIYSFLKCNSFNFVFFRATERLLT